MINGLYAYNQRSGGSKELCTALGIPRLRHEGSKFVGKPEKTIVNWGSTELPSEVLKCRVINHPDRVAVAVNKLSCFENFRNNGVSHPPYFTARSEAVRELERGSMVFARTQLRAHSGNGIVIMDPDFPETWEARAELYVKYIPKRHEYRVHVVNGEVIDVQRKGLKEELRGREGVNWKIQNLANGFVYVRNDGHITPNQVLNTGAAAITSLGLEFGAADVIWNDKSRTAYVLEVNTAPGLVGTTVENYRSAFARHF